MERKIKKGIASIGLCSFLIDQRTVRYMIASIPQFRFQCFTTITNTQFGFRPDIGCSDFFRKAGH